MANVDYSKHAKIHALIDSLSLELREVLVTQHLPTTFMSSVTLLTLIDNQHRLFRPAPHAGHTQQTPKSSFTTLMTTTQTTNPAAAAPAPATPGLFRRAAPQHARA